MDCRAQVSLEALVILTAFIVFIYVLVHAEVEAIKELPKPQLEDHNVSNVFGKSRSAEANFTRWFR